MKIVENIKQALHESHNGLKEATLKFRKLTSRIFESKNSVSFSTRVQILLILSIFLGINIDATSATKKTRKDMDELLKDLTKRSSILIDENSNQEQPLIFSADDFKSGSDGGLDSPPDPTDIEYTVAIFDNLPDTVNVEQGGTLELELSQQLPENIEVQITMAGANEAEIVDNGTKIKYFAGRDIEEDYKYWIEITDTETNETFEVPPKRMYITKGNPVVNNSWPEDNTDVASVGELMNYGVDFSYPVDTLETEYTYYKTGEKASGVSWGTQAYENTTTPVLDNNYYGEDVVTVWNIKENGEKADTTITFKVHPPDSLAFQYPDDQTFFDTVYYQTEWNQWVEFNEDTQEWEQINFNPKTINLSNTSADLKIDYIVNDSIVKSFPYIQEFNEFPSNYYDFLENSTLVFKVYCEDNPENVDSTKFFVEVIGEDPGVLGTDDGFETIENFKVGNFYKNPIDKLSQTGHLPIETRDINEPIIVEVYTNNGQRIWASSFKIGVEDCVSIGENKYELIVRLANDTKRLDGGISLLSEGIYTVLVKQGRNQGFSRVIVE